MGGPPRGPTPSSTSGASAPTPASRPASAAPKAKYPPGDRSHIPANAQKLVELLSSDMQRVASKAPTNFKPQVNDTQKRINLLFDALNNEILVKPDTVEQLTQLAEAIASKQYDVASKLQVEIHSNKADECGNWMVSWLNQRMITI